MKLVSLINTNNLSLLSSLLNNIVYVYSAGHVLSFGLRAKTYISFNRPFLNVKFFTFISKFSQHHTIFKIFYFLSRVCWAESSLSCGFFTMLDLVGLGFRAMKISDRVFFFDLGMASGFYFLAPSSLRLFISPVIRRLLLFSTNYMEINNVISTLFLLRKVNSYKISGFQPVKRVLRLRRGKQR